MLSHNLVSEVEHLRAIGREEQANKFEANLEKLRALTEAEKGKGLRDSRGNGTGTVAPRRNCQGKVIGYRGAFFGPDGKRRWVSAKTKTECWAKLNAAMTDADRGILPSPATLTVDRYLSAWLTDSIEGKLARASHDAYKRDVHYHIIPSLGRRKLKELSTPDIRRFYRNKRDEGLSNRSLQYIHTTLRKALEDAKNDGGILTRNPTDGVRPHKTPQGAAKESKARP